LLDLRKRLPITTLKANKQTNKTFKLKPKWAAIRRKLILKLRANQDTSTVFKKFEEGSQF
jgi:hypothetical protein